MSVFYAPERKESAKFLHDEVPTLQVLVFSLTSLFKSLTEEIIMESSTRKKVNQYKSNLYCKREFSITFTNCFKFLFQTIHRDAHLNLFCQKEKKKVKCTM